MLPPPTPYLSHTKNSHLTKLTLSLSLKYNRSNIEHIITLTEGKVSLYSSTPVYFVWIGCFVKWNEQQFYSFGQIQTSQTGGRPFSDTSSSVSALCIEAHALPLTRHFISLRVSDTFYGMRNTSLPFRPLYLLCVWECAPLPLFLWSYISKRYEKHSNYFACISVESVLLISLLIYLANIS